MERWAYGALCYAIMADDDGLRVQVMWLHKLDINPPWPSDKNNAELDVYIRYFLFEVLPVYAYLDWIVS